MADGSPEDRAGRSANDISFSDPEKSLGETNKCSDETSDTFDEDNVKLSFFKKLNAKISCKNSETRGVAAKRAADADYQNSLDSVAADGDDRKRRCIDRYDSSESSDSGVAVLSPTESSSGCSGSSDITEPRSPRSPCSPESACSTGEESGGGSASARMPPWASDPAPPAARRLAAQPVPLRRPNPSPHRRITEYFNHKMKPHNGLKRDHAHNSNQDDTKKKCLPKNGVTHDLEKYISYLSQTLSPKVLMDVGRQAEPAVRKPAHSTHNGALNTIKSAEYSRTASNTTANGILNTSKSRDALDRVYTTMNGFVDVKKANDQFTKDRSTGGHLNRFTDTKKHTELKKALDPSANGINKRMNAAPKGKVPIPALPTTTITRSPIKLAAKPDNAKMNGIVSSTTKLDSKMNSVMCGSNNLSLNPSTPKLIPLKRELNKKAGDGQPAKRTNRKSSACIANSKNLTWSKANNLKQVQMQKQNCMNTPHSSSVTNIPGDASTAPQMTIPNGVRQVPMTVNGGLANLNMPVTNLQNCQINIPQPCNGTATPNNLTSFVAVPPNVMLTTLRIPQNGIPAQTLTHQNNIPSFNRPNVNVSSPTKLNGQFVFPLMQNINGTVVQIPNLMAKMPNFVLPQNPQLTQRQDHLQNHPAAQYLINGGTLLKLANTMTPAYTTVNKNTSMTTQSMPPMNKNVPGVQAVGMTVQPKPNYAVNFSHPVLMPQAGFIVTSMPNMNVKETWSNVCSPATSVQSSCSNTPLHHPPPLVTFTNQALHTSSIPIAPVKPPDNPIQGTEPPSSTVKEPEINEVATSKCDIPWLSKTVNNNIFQFQSNKINTRPFAQVSSTITEKMEVLTTEKVFQKQKNVDVNVKETDDVEMEDNSRVENISKELSKVEEVARREETLFTQITVLKDVSSNVHNTLIEANFCSATTESESGIGTDKSIDSPSDSQTSKECDDDSSLSLSISVSSVEVQSQKSPILKQPKTLRFPPRNLAKSDSDRRKSGSDTTSTVSVCLWENCKKEFDEDPELLEHLQSAHVETQAGKENYVCLWERCKVRGKPSCSRLWLERHTLSHGGNKPFKCIVDGCERRFSSQTLLEKHVNNHFNEASPSANSNKKSSDGSSKLIRRNGKKLRYRRQPWSARMFDFFDPGMMEGLAWRLTRCTRWRLGGACPLREPSSPRHMFTLHVTLTATRYNAAAGTREALVTYYPPNVLEDEWVPEKDVKRIKRVEIAKLPVHTKVLMYEQFCLSYKAPARKPLAIAPTTSKNNSSSRLLNNLMAKQRKSSLRSECSTYTPALYFEEERTVEVSGAKKRKMGRRYGGNSFKPCGR